MSIRFDYTTRARRVALKYPLLSDIGTQMAYWIFAFTLYFTLVNHISEAVKNNIPPDRLFSVDFVDETILKGKTEKIKLFHVNNI